MAVGLLLGLSLVMACARGAGAVTMSEVEPVDAIVVLGHRPPYAGMLDDETRQRVDHGIALYRAGLAPLLVFSGGESRPGTVEADRMAAHAERAGVPASAILREAISRNTMENARASVGLLRGRLGDRAPRVVLVTSDYHSERAARLLRCAGAEVQPHPVVVVMSARERRRRLRGERWVGFYYRFIDACARAAGRS